MITLADAKGRAVAAVTTIAPTEHAVSLFPGYKLDRYELLCPIAEGGMASVWVARQRGKHGFEKLVAIKTILPKFASDPRFQRMFLDEAQIASRIEHVNVAQIFDLGEENEVLYLAMEYVEGDALSRLIKGCQRKGIVIPTPIILRVLADVCSGLHEAHELRDPRGRLLEIVHRDVSPHNILVSTRGTAKVIDFGIAKVRSRVESETHSGVLKGKVHFMAPEQAMGSAVDRRADVWAAGAVLYQVLAGRAPYEADSQLAALALLRSGRPPSPLPSIVPPPIAALVRKALSYAPEQRYESAAHFREAIERVMSDTGLTATTEDVARFATRHLAERVQRRRQAIELALSEAAERSRARGVSEARVTALLASSSTFTAPAYSPATTPVSSAATQAEGAPGSASEPPRSGSFTVATVRSPSSRRMFLTAGGAVATLALVAGVGLALRSPSGPSTTTAASAPAKAAAPAVPSPVAVFTAPKAEPTTDVPTTSSEDLPLAPASRVRGPWTSAARPSRHLVAAATTPSPPSEAPPSAPAILATQPPSSPPAATVEGPTRSRTVDDGF